LLVDLQATGESPGEAITFGWRERHDVAAAVAFIRQQLPDRKVAALGTSLGGAAALLASPPLAVDALVVEAVYPEIEAAVRNRLEIRLGLPGRSLAPLLLWQLPARLGVRSSDLRPIDHIASVSCPVLVIGGAVDRHTTPAETRALYSAAREPKELWIVPAAGHVDLHRFAPRKYEQRVLAFFDAALR
jgi:fermentation-respiration switch protein FrsA (DUF1100 family)